MKTIKIRKLEKGEVVEIDGLFFRKIEGEFKKDDLYIAERNTGIKLLVVKKIVKDVHGGYLVPTSKDYFFNFNECVKVEEVMDNKPICDHNGCDNRAIWTVGNRQYCHKHMSEQLDARSAKLIPGAIQIPKK